MDNYFDKTNSPILESHHWAVQEIRRLPALGDLSIAVRNQVPYGVPDRFFNAYIQNGIVKTAIRNYPDYFNKEWVEQFEVGTGTACAISFDGKWVMYNYKWRFVTSELPFIFWVDNDGSLWKQLWDDVDTKEVLSTGVTKVKAIRAWKNVSYPDRDHGVVCAYTKSDGKAYYRSYCYQEIDDSFAWENEVEIEEFTGTAVNLNLFITNDYRTGIVIEDSLGKITWLITERNWAGMAIAPEIIHAKPYEIKLNLIDLENPKGYEDIHLKAYPYNIDLNLKFALKDNEILSAENKPDENNDWGFIIEFKTKYPIDVLTLSNVTAKDVVKGTLIGMASVMKINEYHFRLNVDRIVETGINNVLGDIKIELASVYNEAGYLYDEMDITFTPINLEPEFIPIPEVDEVWNE